jgi:SAM-dependent methyltransferase
MPTTTAEFFLGAIEHFLQRDPKTVRLLDFGCGRGELVDSLFELGVDAHGCDIDPYWESDSTRLRPMTKAPYRIPFEDGSMDVVVSTSVLEHASNVGEVFDEIGRVLRPGGLAMHVYPAKWFLPYEPHILVPLVNILWPHVPRWWLALWAWLGVRNVHQRGRPWRGVVAENATFVAKGVCYYREGTYRAAAASTFSSFETPMRYFLSFTNGGAAALYRRSPIKRPLEWIFKHTRSVFLVTRKA